MLKTKLAEELTDKHNRYHCSECHSAEDLNAMFVAAINEALERAAQEAEATEIVIGWDFDGEDEYASDDASETLRSAAVRIRALKGDGC